MGAFVRKLLFLALVLLLVQVAFAQTGTTKADSKGVKCDYNYKDVNFNIQTRVWTDGKDGLLTGTVCDYYENRKLFYATPIKNGKIEGVDKTYYENGVQYFETPYKNDRKEGVEKGYYESGKLKYELPYENGEKQGTLKWYYENGKLQYEIVYKDGVEVSGSCYRSNGDKVPLTDTEITNRNNISCE